MKLRKAQLRNESAQQSRFPKPLVALALMAPLIAGCREKPEEAPQERGQFEPEPEIPHFVPSAPPQKAAPLISAQPETPASIDAESAPEAVARADTQASILAIISGRVNQASPKMKLTPEEGQLAESYVRLDLPQMPSCIALSERMPETTVELLRAARERGVSRGDAEAIAEYLVRMLDSMQLKKTEKFDECCSHVLGRRWAEIDYSGESLDPIKQERFYSSRGIPDLLTAEHVRRYFAVESKMPYFKRIFDPQGPLPEF